VNKGRLNAITQYISTIYSLALCRLASDIRISLKTYFDEDLQGPLSTLYDRYAVDIVLVNPDDEQQEWRFMVIEVNPLFELTGEGLFESEEGRTIINGEAEVDYPVMRVQEMKMVDGTERNLLDARRQVEKELEVAMIN
jgi:hypothetical protein